MSLLRAFIALEIPSSIQQSIFRATQALQNDTRALIRWVAQENIHLTLKFLGDIPSTSLEALAQVLYTEADACQAFDIHINGFGSFPSLKRPRVIFIGIQAPAGLEALRLRIESGCVWLGYAPEDRGFSPHLTLGRVKQNGSVVDGQKLRRALEGMTIDSLGTARVDSVHLYKSELKPGGAVYTKLFSAKLK